MYTDIFVSFTNGSFSAREGEGVVFLAVSKSGETQDDIDVIISLRDITAIGEEVIRGE